MSGDRGDCLKYSQNDEERVILETFAGKTDGRFLDIGAYDAKMLSNTRALYEQGWSGVMVEPSPEPFVGLLREYGHDPRIELVHVAVGREGGLVKMTLTPDALSTTNEGNLGRLREGGFQFSGTAWVYEVSLYGLLSRFAGPFDFVSIDVEGGSAELFLQFLEFLPYRHSMVSYPTMFCVEHDHRAEELKAAAAKQGYAEVLRNGENQIFVRQGWGVSRYESNR